MLITLDLNKTDKWPPDHGLRLHPRIEFYYCFPWWFLGSRTTWRCWLFWYCRMGLSWERDSWFLRILGFGIEYSWQPMTDQEAEDLLQFIQDEQAAGEDFDES